MTVFGRLLSTPEAVDAFGDEALLAAMLRFEAALAKAQAQAGLIPAAAAQSIAWACGQGTIAAAFDMAALERDARSAGTIVIPLVKALRDAVSRRDASAAQWVHFGSTSQDVIDTAMALATRRVLDLVEADVRAAVGGLLGLARTHAATPVLARTLLQPASVTSFGLKCARWALPLARGLARLRELSLGALCVQLGGAAGTRAQLGPHADRIVAALAAELSLAVPEAVWHTARDEWIALGCEFGVLAGSLGKTASDLALMGQFEVGEVTEPAGSSSAMPHKRNPLGSMIARTAALRAPGRIAALLAAMPQEHERALGGWQAEGAEWAELLQLVHGAARAMATVIKGLSVDAARMLHNIEAVRSALPADAAAEWFDPETASALAPEVERLCARVEALLA